MNEKKQENSNWLPFIAGAVAGGVIGYLIASGKGKEFWEELKKKSGELKDQLGDEFEDLKDLFAEEETEGENANGKQG
jgi:gas vesicle protein